jgi:hypothetical protein
MSQYSRAQYREYASHYAEVDDLAAVSIGDDDGAYVQIWMWVSDEDMRRAGHTPTAIPLCEDDNEE